jgi:hypothetical protein
MAARKDDLGPLLPRALTAERNPLLVDTFETIPETICVTKLPVSPAIR